MTKELQEQLLNSIEDDFNENVEEWQGYFIKTIMDNLRALSFEDFIEELTNILKEKS